MKAVSLISVGIDSPVATHIMKEQGVEIIGLNFSTKDKDEVLIQLSRKAGIKELRQVDMTSFHESISIDEKYRCILCKRYMIKAAAKIAKEIGADFIITGDNLAQVASQTLENMKVISTASDIPIIRPLLTYDKQEIIEIARNIDTFDLSIKVNDRCPYVPKQPATRSILSRIEKLEENLPPVSSKTKVIYKQPHAQIA